jgi:hypothetical protein
MQKRRVIIGEYDTAAAGWTLTGWKLSAAEQKTKYKDKPNGDGVWDLSTAATDGIPRYNTRALAVTLECSDGDRMTRETEIRRMVNLLDGLQWHIELPDDADHYIVGRVHVARDYNDLAHAQVTVTATCEPWKYARSKTIVTAKCTSSKQTLTLTNSGRRTIAPTITVTGEDADVLLELPASSKALPEGEWQWPALALTPGSHVVTYSGTGMLAISYREAVLE